MARIRSIKPEFWTSEQVMECSRDARLLFIGLWNFADDTGRHPFNPKQIKALVFPGDGDPVRLVEQWLGELEKQGLIAPYEAAGKRYLQITGWHHQKIDRPQASKCPDPTTNAREDSGRFDDHSTIIRRSFATDRIGEDKKGKDQDAAPPAAASNGHRPPDAELYDRGKQILGANSGGMVRKLVAAKGGSIPQARAALETASEKSDARQYIGAIISSRERGLVATDDLIS